jgi:hypothetical protein
MLKQLLFSASLLLPLSGANPAREEADSDPRIYGEWELDRNAGGVKTYTRWIIVDRSHKVRERKGEMALNCTVNDAVRLLCDTKITGSWMSGIKENYCLKQISQSEWFTYTLFDIPWPFEERDLISNYRVKNLDEGNGVVILINSREDYLPEKQNIQRLANYTANWTIVRMGDARVSISFSAIADTPPMFPRFIQDPVLAQLFHNNLVNLKKMLDS